MLLFTHGKKPKKSVLDQAYFSHLFWLFTMSKKLIFCKKYFLQNIIFLLMVKSRKKREKYASSSTLFGLFTMSKKVICHKKLPFHCAHTKLFTLNFIFHWIPWFKYSILFTTFGVIKSTLNSIFYINQVSLWYPLSQESHQSSRLPRSEKVV